MFDYARSVFGAIDVTEKDGIIKVRGASGRFIYKDIKRLFKTTRVSEHMFTDISGSSFSFYSFFLPDVLYTINTLIAKGSYYESKRTLSNIRDELMENSWIKRISEPVKSKLNMERLNDFVFTPKDFQLEFFNIYDKLTQQYNLNGFLFAGAAGSGKTYSALALTYCLEVEVIMVICPKNAINRVWEDTIKNNIKNPPKYHISSSTAKRTGEEKVLIFHYEDISKAITVAQEIKNKRIGIILDESHNLNEITSMRSNLFVDLCKNTKSKDVIWLSGTPIKALAKETIPLFRCVDPLFTDKVEESFKKIFRGDAGKAVEILNNRLGLVNFVVPKSRLGLADPIMNTVSVQIPNGEKYTFDAIHRDMEIFIKERFDYWKAKQPAQWEFYKQVIADHIESIKHDRVKLKQYDEYEHCFKILSRANFYMNLKYEMELCNKYEAREIMPEIDPDKRKEFKEVKTCLKYLPLKIKGECLGTIIGGARKNCFTDLARSIDFNFYCETTVKKTLVFGTYVESILAAKDRCLEQKLSPVLVYGATNKNLNNIIKDFESNAVVNPIIATFDSLSTAVPLVMCDVIVMINLPFRDYEMQQAVSRIHRLGADTQTYVNIMLLDTGDKPNISTRSKEILQWSQKAVEAITGVESPFDIKDGDSIDQYNVALEGINFETPAFLNWN